MKRIILLSLSLIVLISYGCAMQSDLVDLENEVRKMKGMLMETQQDVARLQKTTRGYERTEIERLKNEIVDFRTSTEERLNTIAKGQADLEAEFDQLTTDIRIIQGKLEENNYKLSELSARLDDQEMHVEDLDRRVDIIETRFKKSGTIILPGKPVMPKAGSEKKTPIKTEVKPPIPSVKKTQEEKQPQPAGKMKQAKPLLPQESTSLRPEEGTHLPGAMGTGPVKGVSEGTSLPPGESTVATTISPSQIYKWAYKDYLEGNYDLAIAGFRNYLRVIPAGALAPNAHYWIGECYYSKGDYEKAIKAFEDVLNLFPRSDKVTSALLKIGYSYEKMDNKDKAISYYKQIIEKYPFSREASLAKVRLAEIR